jgi:hypothetical protein
VSQPVAPCDSAWSRSCLFPDLCVVFIAWLCGSIVVIFSIMQNSKKKSCTSASLVVVMIGDVIGAMLRKGSEALRDNSIGMKSPRWCRNNWKKGRAPNSFLPMSDVSSGMRKLIY